MIDILLFQSFLQPSPFLLQVLSTVYPTQMCVLSQKFCHWREHKQQSTCVNQPTFILGAPTQLSGILAVTASWTGLRGPGNVYDCAIVYSAILTRVGMMVLCDRCCNSLPKSMILIKGDGCTFSHLSPLSGQWGRSSHFRGRYPPYSFLLTFVGREASYKGREKKGGRGGGGEGREGKKESEREEKGREEGMEGEREEIREGGREGWGGSNSHCQCEQS